MGDTYATITIHGPRGSTELRALVDTGATFTKIPRSDAERIGLEVKRETLVQLSTGQLVPRGLGFAEAELEGAKGVIPVAVGADGEPPLIGYTALEIFELKPNPSTRSLEPTRPIEY